MQTFNTKGSQREFWLTFPSFVWLLLFFVIPTVIIVILAFKPNDTYGTILEGWTLEHIKNLWTPGSLMLIWKTFWISCVATFLSVILSIPVCYYIAQKPEKLQDMLLFAVILPFWTSFLIRVFAWKSLLHPEGFIKQILSVLHLMTPQSTLLYNAGAVIFLMVASYLPFAILPIYAAASKFDLALVEAAMDLGATRTVAFFKIFIPGIARGILNGTLIILIPIVGAYAIPDLVGGTHSEMIGNKIAQKIFIARSLPEGSAWSLALAMLVFVPLLIGYFLHYRNRRGKIELRNVE